MKGWSESFSNFFGLILIFMFATLFWQAFKADMEKRNNPNYSAQSVDQNIPQVQVQYTQPPVNNSPQSPIISSQYIKGN